MKNFKRLAFVIVVCVMASGLYIVPTQAAGDYSFKVHNTTDTAIKKILVSQDKKEWGEFDVGKGIKAGAAVTLVWDESTSNEDCKQYVKAVFSDGSESTPAKFDFCAKDLELEFQAHGPKGQQREFHDDMAAHWPVHREFPYKVCTHRSGDWGRYVPFPNQISPQK